MRTRETLAREVEKQRAAAKVWGTGADAHSELSWSELLQTFCGIGLLLTVFGGIAAYTINALREAGIL